MSEIILGRVQGGSIFYSTANSNTIVARNTLSPTLTPFIDDSVQFSNGDLRKIVSVSTDSVTCGDVLANFKGANGIPGQNGTTFTPAVDSSGNLSWTNDGGKENPEPVNIKGADGQGVPAGGTAGQVLKKKTDSDYDTEWGNSIAAADSATNVTAQINGKNITDIFETDGTTVKKATSVKKYIHIINAAFRRYDASFSDVNPFRHVAVVILVITNKDVAYTAETFVEDKDNIKRFIANGNFFMWIKNGESYEQEMETVCWGSFIEAIVNYSTGSEMCISFASAQLSSVGTTRAFSVNEVHTFTDTIIPL